MDIAPWLNYGGLGLCAFVIAVGVPWLLKHLREKDAIHQAVVDKNNTEHTARVNALLVDNKDERISNIAALDKVCLAFKGASESEDQICEKRIKDLKEIYNNQFASLREDVKELQEKNNVAPGR